MAAYIWGDHLYCVADTGVRQSIAHEAAGGAAPCQWTLAPIRRKDRGGPSMGDWELFTGLRAGHYYSRDLHNDRLELHRASFCPQVQKNGLGGLKSLRYHDCHIHALPREAGVCTRFLVELAKLRPHSVAYRAETFAGFGQLVFDSLCEVDQRDPPTLLERQAVLARAHGRCEGCGDALADSSWEIDHHVPRSAFGRDSRGNFSALCKSCHSLKTWTTDASRCCLEDRNPFLSRLSQEMWDAFVESRRPTQVVADLHEPGKGPWWHADVGGIPTRVNPFPTNQHIKPTSPPHTSKLIIQCWFSVLGDVGAANNPFWSPFPGPAT